MSIQPYYAADGITLYHGTWETVLPQIADASIDLVLTSPPYNLGNTTGGGIQQYKAHYNPAGGMAARGGRGKWPGASLANGYDGHDDTMPHPEYVAWQHALLRECWRVLSDHGAIFYNHKPRILGGQLITPLDYNPDLPVRQIVIWARAGGINFSPTFYCPTHEWIVILAKAAWRLKSNGASGVGDVWMIPQEANPDHPAPFPLKLALRVIETTPAQVILDPHAGIGTTLRAAKTLGRRAIGIERSERYCEIAAAQLTNTTRIGEQRISQPSLLEVSA